MKAIMREILGPPLSGTCPHGHHFWLEDIGDRRWFSRPCDLCESEEKKRQTERRQEAQGESDLMSFIKFLLFLVGVLFLAWISG